MTTIPSDRFAPLHRLLQEGFDQQVYTAAVAAVGLKGELCWQAAVGRVSQAPGAALATLETVFDLASLTKPLATALALMVLVQAGKLSLHAPLGEILPVAWLPADKRPLTVASLLAHRAGLAAWRPFYQEVLAAPPALRPGMLARLAATAPLEHPPDTATLYSNLGYMLLQAVVEALAGQDLARWCRREVYRPLGLEILGFCPRRRPHGDLFTYAATEPGLIPEPRLPGEVHDENAWAAGGVAGHAGLFGTAGEVFRLISTFYRAYVGETSGLLAPEAVRAFLTPIPGAGRTPGFDLTGGDGAPSAAGRFFSPLSVGHLGFTGTSFWLDLELGQMVVLLTNRVHLGRDDKAKIQAFRPRFHEAASRALGFTKTFRS